MGTAGAPKRENHVKGQACLVYKRNSLLPLTLEVFCTPSIDSICRHVHRQLMRNELARFYHHRTRKCMPPKKLRRIIQ
jgi:hypothetical protein